MGWDGVVGCPLGYGVEGGLEADRAPVGRLGWHKHLPGLVYMEAITDLLMVCHSFPFLLYYFRLAFKRASYSSKGHGLGIPWQPSGQDSMLSLLGPAFDPGLETIDPASHVAQ